MVKSTPIPCTKEEMEAIINASIEDEFSYLLFNVAKKTGRRLGEYYNVQIKDLDLEKGIMMTQVLKRKKIVFKEAILDEELTTMIKRYILKNKLKLEDYLFRKISYRQIQNKIIKYSKKAGINHKVTFHNFRHYFITELFRKGWPYERIAKLTGHSSVGTLSIYEHTVASDIADEAREAIKGL